MNQNLYRILFSVNVKDLGMMPFSTFVTDNKRRALKFAEDCSVEDGAEITVQESINGSRWKTIYFHNGKTYGEPYNG